VCGLEKQRSILHCDLNNFYVSVACRDHPELKGKAVAVGGSTAERHGIILAKSETAKKFGIQTGEPLWQARQKCPNLIIMPPEFKRYTYFSGEVRKIYERYTDLIEPFGIDECWLDVTGSRLLFGDGVTIADRLRSEIKKELDLTISVGVSFNKIFAKLGSDLKKPDATSVIPPERFKEIVWPLEVESLLGVGRSTSKKLHDLAVFTVGDLATIDPEALRLRLGKNGVMLWHFANGEENSAVLKSDYIERPKSIGRSTTCPKDLYTFDEVYRVFLSLAEEVARELRKTNLQAEGLAVHIRTDKLEVREFMMGLKMPLSAASVLAKEGIGLLKQNYDFDRPLRSVGIRAIRLVDAGSCCQLSFFEDEMQIIKQDILETCVDKIRDRFGQTAIVRASLLNDFKAFKDQAPTTLGRSRLSL
jgi:DNA polymerase-4